MDYKKQLASIRVTLGTHIVRVSKLQKQIEKEEKAIFACLAKEEKILLKLSQTKK